MEQADRRVSVSYRGVEVYLGVAGWTSDELDIGAARTVERALEAVDVALETGQKRHVEQSADL